MPSGEEVLDRGRDIARAVRERGGRALVDGGGGRAHQGFPAQGDPLLSVEEAARRRDFTVNAIAWDPLTGEYLDPHGGRADLQASRLRAVDPHTFGDDSLRVLRALQPSARFPLGLGEGTGRICRATPPAALPAGPGWGGREEPPA